MTQVTVPAPGDAIDLSWGQDVANRINHVIPLYMSSDVSKTSGSFSDVTGLTFPVVNGKFYTINLVGSYTVGGTSTGIGIGYTSPGGTTRLLATLYSTSYISGSNEWLSSSDTATGTSTTHSTAEHQFQLRGTYQCTSDGTFAIRYNRNGTSTTVAILAGSGGTVVES